MRSALACALVTSALTLACKAHPASSAKVVNGYGQPAAGEYKQVVSLFVSFDSTPLTLVNCTGSIVRDDLILTAGHCLTSATHNLVAVSVRNVPSGTPPTSTEVVTMVDQHLDFYQANVVNDAAFVIFPHGTFQSDWIGTLSQKAVAPGDAVTLIGSGNSTFGDQDSNSSGQINVGRNTVTAVFPDKSRIVISKSPGDTQSAVADHGDSGGPLIDASGHIVGIDSTVGSAPNLQYSTYVGILYQPIKQFIANVMADPGPKAANKETYIHTVAVHASP